MADGVMDRVQDLLAQVDALRHEVVETGADAQLVIGLRALEDRLHVVVSHAVCSFADTTPFADLGFANAGAWMAANIGGWSSEARTRRRHIRLLTELPAFAHAVHTGTVTVAHLDVLTKAVTIERLPLAHRDQHVLTDHAATMDVERFALIVRHWAALCDDELHDLTDHDTIEQRRSVRLHQLPDGSWRLDGHLTGIAGEALAAAFAAFMPKPSKDDPRTIVQRRHDTMEDIAHDVLSRTDRPDVGGERPHVTITITSETGIAVTETGVVLPGFLRDSVLCDCTSATVWLTASGVPFDAGTPHTAIPARTRRAVIARDRCCRYPHCSRPARWTDVHHLRHRADQGNNDIGNLALICKFHHRLMHRLGLRAWFDTDGITLMIEWPGGIVLRSPPRPTLVPQ